MQAKAGTPCTWARGSLRNPGLLSQLSRVCILSQAGQAHVSGVFDDFSCCRLGLVVGDIFHIVVGDIFYIVF